ncbi:pro-sigmaK processing inhibitor BofA family protein [Anaerosinus massiliensis]|uniref:pro-sigmaK processing inhibitor BofA family protein n=1 Tax=Massilibacillus massiliensis TaxID=1806837 RepID=UPI000A985364|nr:pro-sigmaK processing inhibitor BofA family protein [Massilibacillus massiliensis]
MELSVIAAYVVGILAIYFIGRMFLMPVRIVWKLIYNGVVGGIMLWVVNFVGANFGFEIGINVLSALVAGFLGIPGVILLILFKVMF